MPWMHGDRSSRLWRLIIKRVAKTDQVMNVEQLYEKYGPMVLKRCRRLLENEEEALDATQDVFVKLLQIERTQSIEHPSSFLYVMASNLCLSRIRDRRRHGESGDESLLEEIAVMGGTEDRTSARSVLRKLFGMHHESSRTIALLHFVDGMTLEETAREVGMSVSGVRKRLRSLRTTLARIETS
jgi:RNA polymerase sigma-70 factor (ECF subfamily)